MASLVLGGIGGLMFGPIGFLAGSLIGNLLSPTKQEGPRLSNLKLQGSSYGQMIPIPYGTIRLAGQVVWQTDLVEHKHNSGGKGGPQVTTYTYTVSFAVKICKGPVAGILAMWANGEIIYDVRPGSTVDNSKVPVKIYNGYESALPDPTMEADLGVGHVPAFRDDCAVVFTDLDVGKYGNTLPQLSFLVFASGSPIPWRVNTFGAVPFAPGVTIVWSPAFDSTLVGEGPITIGEYSASSGPFNSPPTRYWQREFDLDGNANGTDIVASVLEDLDPGTDYDGMRNVVPVIGGPWPMCFAFSAGTGGGGSAGRGSWYIRDMLSGVPLPASGSGPFGSAAFSAVNNTAVYQNGYIYAIANNTLGSHGIARWLAPGGIPTGVFDKTAAIVGANNNSVSNFAIGSSDTGDIYVAINSNLGGDPPELFQYDADLNLIHRWTSLVNGGTPPYIPSAAPDGFRSANPGFFIFNGMLCDNTTEPSAPPQAYFDTVWRIESDFSFTKDPAVAPIINGPVRQPDPQTGGGSPLCYLANGLALGVDGIISLNPRQLPITLASIVANISKRVNLASSEYDVSQLTDLVDGYLITTRTDARTDIDQLRSAYFFDGTDRGGQAVFVKRGAAPVITIPDDELAAQTKGEAGPPKVEVQRVQEIELPALVDVKYINSGAAYQEGDQHQIRQATISSSPADVSLAIAMSDTKARQIANVLLYDPIASRNKCKWSTNRKYLYLEPTDTIIAGGKIMRIERKTAKINGIVAFEGPTVIPSLYTIALASAGTSGGQQPTVGTAQTTQLALLGIPLISDGDDGTAFYAGMAGAVDTTWRGANLNQSVDGGATWNVIASTGLASTMGRASDTLGDFGGGNIFDEINSVTVVIGPGGGTLAGATRAAVMGGANLALVGTEIIGFRNADLISANTYKLSGLLRGRRGTEWRMGTHSPNEPFILLSTVIKVNDPISYRGRSVLYKAVTFNATLASAVAQTFVDNAITLQPYSPVLLGGGPNSSGDVIINWVRRTRIGGEWVNFADVPLSEASEQYVLQVWDAAFVKCARVVIGITSSTFTYTSAMQLVDFAAKQSLYYISVAEVGSYGLGVQEFAVIPGAGGSVTAPLSPKTPYNATPPPPPPLPTTCPGNVVVTTIPWVAGLTQFFSAGLFANPFGPGDTWVLKIVVPSSPNIGPGSLIGVEYGGPPTPRTARWSLSPCGLSVKSGVAVDDIQGSNAIDYSFYSAGANPAPANKFNLFPSTTYYVSITSPVTQSDMLINFTCQG